MISCSSRHRVIRNWFMLNMRKSSYGCTWEVWRTREKLNRGAAESNSSLLSALHTSQEHPQLCLSYNLRCYKRISSPEKSRNNTREKISYFFTRAWYRQSVTKRHSPFALLDQVDEWMAEPPPFSIQGRLSEFLWMMAAKTLGQSVSLTDSDVQTFPEREENQNITFPNPYVLVSFKS